METDNSGGCYEIYTAQSLFMQTDCYRHCNFRGSYWLRIWRLLQLGIEGRTFEGMRCFGSLNIVAVEVFANNSGLLIGYIIYMWLILMSFDISFLS